MAELLATEISQERIGAITSSVGRIIENPFVVAVLQRDTPSKSLGWGIIEYRVDESTLGGNPRTPGQEPAEITYYAEVPDIDVEGTIFWHGPESLARREGELFGIYLDPELIDGRYTHYHQVRVGEDSHLEIGRPDPEGTSDLLPPEEPKLRNLELKLSALVGYIEGISRALQ